MKFSEIRLAQPNTLFVASARGGCIVHIVLGLSSVNWWVGNGQLENLCKKMNGAGSNLVADKKFIF